MARLDHHAHTRGPDVLHDRLGDLLAQAFLQLQAARKHVDNARQLADAKHLAGRNVANVATAEERQHVVLAHAVELDILHDHHAVGVLREDGAVDDVFEVSSIAGGQEFKGLGHARRSLLQSLARRVLAEFHQQFAHQYLDTAKVG